MKGLRVAALALLAWACSGAFAITSATVTVTTSGTPVPLAGTSTLVSSLTVQPVTAGLTICVGGSTVSASAKTGTCITTASGGAVPYYAVAGVQWDLNKIYVDASSNGGVVTVTYAF